jgi:hypothetical protein
MLLGRAAHKGVLVNRGEARVFWGIAARLIFAGLPAASGADLVLYGCARWVCFLLGTGLVDSALGWQLLLALHACNS